MHGRGTRRVLGARRCGVRGPAGPELLRARWHRGACGAMRRATTAAPVAAPPLTLQLVLPLAANDARARAVRDLGLDPRSPHVRAHYQLAAAGSSRGSAPRRRRAGASCRYLRRAGARDVEIDATGLFADATMTVGRPSACSASQLAQFAQRRAGTRVHRAARRERGERAAPRAGRAAGRRRRSVVGLDTRRLVVAQPPRTRRRRAVAGSVRRPLTGTPAGCRRRPGGRGLHAEPVSDRLRLRPLHAAGVGGQGETVALIEIDGFKDADINAFAQCFGLPVPALNAYGVGGLAAARRRAASRRSTSRCSTRPRRAQGDRRLRVERERRQHAAGADRAAREPGPQPQVVSASLGLCEPDCARRDQPRRARQRRGVARARRQRPG